MRPTRSGSRRVPNTAGKTWICGSTPNSRAATSPARAVRPIRSAAPIRCTSCSVKPACRWLRTCLSPSPSRWKPATASRTIRAPASPTPISSRVTGRRPGTSSSAPASSALSAPRTWSSCSRRRAWLCCSTTIPAPATRTIRTRRTGRRSPPPNARTRAFRSLRTVRWCGTSRRNTTACRAAIPA